MSVASAENLAFCTYWKVASGGLGIAFALLPSSLTRHQVTMCGRIDLIGPWKELFDVQDQVVRTIVGTLVGRLQADRVDRAKRKPPTSLVAYECVLRGDALPVFDRC